MDWTIVKVTTVQIEMKEAMVVCRSYQRARNRSWRLPESEVIVVLWNMHLGVRGGDGAVVSRPPTGVGVLERRGSRRR